MKLYIILALSLLLCCALTLGRPCGPDCHCIGPCAPDCGCEFEKPSCSVIEGGCGVCEENVPEVSNSDESKSSEGSSNESKSGEIKSGEIKSGEIKSGEKKSGEKKSGEKKSGEKESGESSEESHCIPIPI